MDLTFIDTAKEQIWRGLLGFLQVLTVFCSFLIIQVAICVISGIGVDDIRSDDGGEGEEDLEYEAAQLLEVDVEDIDLRGHLLCNPWPS